MFTRNGPFRMIGPTQAVFDGAVDEPSLVLLAADPAIKILQCSAAVPDSVWSLLNNCFFAARPDVQLRLYWFHETPCALRIASLLGNVRRFSADCLMQATNVEWIAEMPHLESLAVGISNLRNFDFLEHVSPALTELSLYATRSTAPHLAPLARFRNLRALSLEGHSNGIELLSSLHALTDLTLRSITTPDLSYLAPLKNLQSLDIKLGGIRSFAGIEAKPNLRYLELWRIRELLDFAILSTLPGLQNLFLQSLPHIASLPFLANAASLRRVSLRNLKAMRDFSPLEHAPALEEFSLLEGRGLSPEQLLPVLRNPALRRVFANFCADGKNRDFARLRDVHGKAALDPWASFAYR